LLISRTGGFLTIDNVTEPFDVAVHQVRAVSTDSRSSNSQTAIVAPRVLEADELTILTGWAQALAEAMTYAPECIKRLLADARAGAPWRAAFRIAEPSPQLNEAIGPMGRAIRDLTFMKNEPVLDALRISCSTDRSGEPRLETRNSCSQGAAINAGTAPYATNKRSPITRSRPNFCICSAPFASRAAPDFSNAIVGGLSERHIFLLRFVGDMELPEIAVATGVKICAIKSHLHRALRTVRVRIGTAHLQCDPARTTY
jgi:hypothetical protein